MQTFLRVLKFLFWRKLVLIPLACLFIVYILISSSTVYIGPNQVGILRKKLKTGTHEGIQKTPLHTGIHLQIPFYEQIDLFPTDLQSIDMTNHGENSRAGRTTQAITIQTSDGYQVTLDVTILYRIADPYTILTSIGPGKLYEDSVVIPMSSKFLRKALGELNPEDFYNKEKRISQAQIAFNELKPKLAEKGIDLLKLLIRKISYDEAYQSQIEQRKIQDQMVFKNRAESAAAREEARKRQIISTGKAAIQVEKEKGKQAVAQIISDANLYKRSKDAEAQLLIKTAQAQGTELENKALEGTGASALVGLKMADVLRGVKVIIAPSNGPGSTNPLNLEDMLKQFEVEK